MLHFHFWPACAQKTEVIIGVIGKSFMATPVLRNLEKSCRTNLKPGFTQTLEIISNFLWMLFQTNLDKVAGFLSVAV